MMEGLPLSHTNIGKLVEEIVRQRLESFWTAVLCRVEEVDQQKCRMKVRPLVKLPVGPDQFEELPIIWDVPIDIARSGPFYVRKAYKEGDIVLAVVLSHSLERVIYDHEPKEPGAVHLQNIQDCVILGGFRADSDPEYPNRWVEDLLIQNEETGDTVVLRHDGGMDIYLHSRDKITLGVYTLQDMLLRSSRGQLQLQAGKKIELGNEPEFRVVLGERLLDWLNSHVHTGVQPGGGVSGPPASPATEALLSKLVWVKEGPPGQLPMPDVEVPQPGAIPALPPGPGKLQRGFAAVAGLPGVGEAIQELINSIGAALGEAVGQFIEEVGTYLWKLGEEAVQLVMDAVVEAIQENWVQLLGLLFTNPAGALALLAEKVGANLLEKLAGVDVEKILGDLAAFITGKAAEYALQFAGELIGVENLPKFVDGVKEVIERCMADGQLTWEDAVREAVLWAQQNYGDDGVKAVLGVIAQFARGYGGRK